MSWFRPSHWLTANIEDMKQTGDENINRSFIPIKFVFLTKLIKDFNEVFFFDNSWNYSYLFNEFCHCYNFRCKTTMEAIHGLMSQVIKDRLFNQVHLPSKPELTQWDSKQCTCMSEPKLTWTWHVIHLDGLKATVS